MRYSTTLFFALTSAVLLHSPGDAQFKGGKGTKGFGAGWLSSLEEAKQQARKTGKPIMAVVRCVP